MVGSSFSRRLSEFVGVLLFASALIWLIALTTYAPTDPVWFFSAGGPATPANFAGRVGAFLAELSYQVLGYAAYLVPAIVAIIGWHYFWCRPIDAMYTKLVGATLLFICIASFLSLAFVRVEIAGTTMLAGGSAGAWVAGWLAEYLNRTGSIIFILTLLFLAIILSTQFSFGRVFAAIWTTATGWLASGLARFRDWRAERRRERKRQQVLRKHLDKTPSPEAKVAALAKVLATAPVKAAGLPTPEAAPKPRRRVLPPAIRPETPSWSTPSLPLAESGLQVPSRAA